MKTSLVFAACFASALAAPTLSWTPTLGAFYAAIDRHVQAARQSGAVTPPHCNLAKAVMPVAPTPLPTPNSTWTLSEVVVGRGVQNYTCDSTNSSSKPVAVGAVASLYNVSCIASNYADVLDLIPRVALQYPVPNNTSDNLEPSNLINAGEHYFSSTGVPTFDLTSSHLGIGRFKKNSNSTAPTDAPKGQNGVGDGAVPWLLLTAANTTEGNLAAVYRINTAGGQPPKDCSGFSDDASRGNVSFSIQYSAEYWFYSHS